MWCHKRSWGRAAGGMGASGLLPARCRAPPRCPAPSRLPPPAHPFQIVLRYRVGARPMNSAAGPSWRSTCTGGRRRGGVFRSLGWGGVCGRQARVAQGARPGHDGAALQAGFAAWRPRRRPAPALPPAPPPPRLAQGVKGVGVAPQVLLRHEADLGVGGYGERPWRTEAWHAPAARPGRAGCLQFPGRRGGASRPSTAPPAPPPTHPHPPPQARTLMTWKGENTHSPPQPPPCPTIPPPPTHPHPPPQARTLMTWKGENTTPSLTPDSAPVR
jgi:hypothetical protein